MFLKYISKLKLANCGKQLLHKSFPSERSVSISSTKQFSTSISRGEKTYAQHLEYLQNNGILFGQPTHQTHPHLLKCGELAIGILPDEFAERRHKLMEKIQKQNAAKRNIVIIPAALKKYMSDKIPYVFRQNSDFYYLTGCLEPQSILVLWTDESNRCKSALFMRPKSKHDELWDGPLTGIDHAVDLFGVDEAYPLTGFQGFVDKFVSKKQSCALWYDETADIQSDLTPGLKAISPSATKQFESPTEFLHELRVIKSPAEIDLMRKTCEIASKAINLTMKESQPGDSEHHIFARVDYHSRMRNASFLAYPPVVAAGNNANTIHYINNTQKTKDGNLILMDAGCEYGGYSSDITRTWPINGKFTHAQEILYDVVYAVHSRVLLALTEIEPITLNKLHDLMSLYLGDYLREVGMLKQSWTDRQAQNASFIFCPHHVSHYLGMDIHDTPLINRNIILEAGMVFTVEPGVYIPADCMDVPAEFRGIGIRIEDDVLYNGDCNIEVLTEKCVKEKSELKRLLSQR